MPETTLSEEDRKVIDSESVQMFEQATEEQAPAAEEEAPAETPPDDPPPDPGPQTRSIVIDGRMQEVPAEVADSIEAERARIEEERQRLEQERQQMSTPKDTETPKDEGFDEKFWSNPGQAVDELVSQRIQQTKDEMSAEQRKQQEQEKFWTDFYGRYPELKDDSDIVEMVLNRNWSELSRLEVASAMDELAKRSATRIGKTLTSEQPPADKHRTASESATPSSETPPPKDPPADESAGSKSLSQLLKERRTKRQQAG